MEMRGLDVWVGRVAAVAGLVYVVWCAGWPFALRATVGTTRRDGATSRGVSRGPARGKDRDTAAAVHRVEA